MNQVFTPRHRESPPPVDLGAAAVALGLVGVLMFFVPVLGVPIGACGMLLAIGGAIGVALGRGGSLRWSIAGFIASSSAVAIGLLIYYAPIAESPRLTKPPLWQMPPSSRFVAPPARPGEFDPP